MVQIYTFFHITNCDVAAWLRSLSTIHTVCGEIDVDPRLILSPPRVETCTPVWEVVDGYVIMSGSDGRPSRAHNPIPIGSLPRSSRRAHEQRHYRAHLHRRRALGPARADWHQQRYRARGGGCPDPGPRDLPHSETARAAASAIRSHSRVSM